MNILMGFLAGAHFTFALQHIVNGSFSNAILPLVVTFVVLAMAFSKD